MVSIAALAEACELEVHRPSAGPVGAPTDGWSDVELIDATHDSRQVRPGWLYCCVSGSQTDGHDYAKRAIEAGAPALMVERVLDVEVPQFVVPSTRHRMGWVAAAIHDHPSRDLIVVAVTGTNGKSSIVQLLSDIYQQAGYRTDIVGTLRGIHTTPESTDLQRLLAGARSGGIEMVAVEVSSHALSFGRVNGTSFRTAIFTNLGRDHLDFHQTIEQYFAAKVRLFTGDFTDHSIINADDPYGRRLMKLASGRVTPYSLDDVEDLRFDGPISLFRWRGHDVVLPLAGTHSVSNAVAAATCAVENGVPVAEAVTALEKTTPVRGRFELVGGQHPFHVAVDYAHTPDALEAALSAARQVAGSNRVVVVFGCGGDRDAEKRPDMGRIAEKGADVVIVTSDNPRSEEPELIIDAIVGGFDEPQVAIVEPDRRLAIAVALQRAANGDVVLIAGKGHETTQIIGDETLGFDDVEVARELLEATR